MTEFSYELCEDNRKNIGLVVLQTDESIEDDFRRLMLPSVRLMVTRIPSGQEVTRESLGAMEDHLTASVGLFPEDLAFDAIGYGCTSGTAQIGPERIAALVRSGAKVHAVSNPLSALIAACEAQGIRRLAILSPYIEAVSSRLRDVLRENGIETPVFGSFAEASEAKVVRISGRSIQAAARQLAAGADVDALFLSCTNLRTLDVIAPLEEGLQMPVLSSNLVLAWDLLRLTGGLGSDAIPGELIDVL